MAKLQVTMVLEVEYTDAGGDVNEYVEHTAAHVTRDPVGWILTRPLGERLPVDVRVKSVGNNPK